MNFTPEELVWIGSGIVLVVLEFFLPGLVVVFLGAAAIMVGLMIHFHWIHGLIQSIGSWFALSTFLMLTVRHFAAKFLLSDSEYKYSEEDADAVGKIVEVIEAIQSDNSEGRIRFQGTDWPARTLTGTIRKGSRAVIKYRDNISWVVEPSEDKNQGKNKKEK